MLSERSAAGLSALLPLLGCGEIAASMAFEGLARWHRDDAVMAGTLHKIADEERIHDGLMQDMQARLPTMPRDEAILAKMRRFHMGLAWGGPVMHLARIAALDSAVCSILGRILRADNGVGDEPAIGTALRRIHRDEARHVQISRAIVVDLAFDQAPHDAAAKTREALADLLVQAGDAFEYLEVDAADLLQDIRRLPRGLLRA